MRILRRSVAWVSLGLTVTGTALAANGVATDKVTLGQSAALTGPSSVQPKELNVGETLYLKNLNAAGGVNGRRIELITYDDQYSPQKAVENVRKLIERDGVFALFAVYGSAISKAILPEVEKADIPLVPAQSSEESLRVPVRRNVFNVRTSSDVEIRALVGFMVKDKGIKDFGMIFQEDAMGMGARLASVAALHAHGLKLAAEAPLKRDSEAVDGAVEAMKKADVKCVILATQVKPTGAILRRAKTIGYKPIFMGHTTLGSNDNAVAAKETDNALYVGLTVPPLDESSPSELVREYLRASKAAGLTPSLAAEEGYLNAMVFAEGLKRAGASPTRDSLRKGLESMSDVSFGGVHVQYSAQSHRGVSAVNIALARDGRFVSVP